MSTIRSDGTGRYYFLQTRGQWYVLDTLSTPVGVGAVGVVYSGFNYYSRQPVAIKMVKPEYANIPFIRDRAKHEAQLTFLHPNIVRMLGVCEFENKYGPIYLVSEFVNGSNFDAYCRNNFSNMDEGFRISHILMHSIKILNALEYVHRAGVIHRDVKPTNIMVTFDGVPKLMDLGIAGFANSRDMSQKSFIGTALYAAPELINCDVIDNRTDIYAMGVTIFEVLAGYNPFQAETQDDVLNKQLFENLPEDDDIHPNLLYILRNATEKDKMKRYKSAQDFAEDLTWFLKDYAPYSIDFSA